MNKGLIWLIVGVTAATWVCVAFISGLPTTWWAAVRPFFSALSAAAFVLWLYDNYIWSSAAFRGWLTRAPDVRGVWQVSLESTYIDPKTGRGIVVTGYAQIDQTATSFQLRLFTERSKSTIIAHSFSFDNSVFRLALVYENTPEVARRENRDSVHHKGAAVYEIRGYSPSSFSGEYWTSDKKVGKITFSNKKTEEINSFAEGVSIYVGGEVSKQLILSDTQSNGGRADLPTGV